jgi:hypothetical protein
VPTLNRVEVFFPKKVTTKKKPNYGSRVNDELTQITLEPLKKLAPKKSYWSQGIFETDPNNFRVRKEHTS